MCKNEKRVIYEKLKFTQSRIVPLYETQIFSTTFTEDYRTDPYPEKAESNQNSNTLFLQDSFYH
jgi:hypothetical protein